MATDTHPVTPTGVIEAVAALGPLISGHAERAERGRRLAPEVLEALDSAGVFRLTAPRAQGGAQAIAFHVTR
jgi:alkylation response protein AidB-like acyl-CoA dehydrogenase